MFIEMSLCLAKVKKKSWSSRTITDYYVLEFVIRKKSFLLTLTKK